MVEQLSGVLGDIKTQISKTCYGDGDVEALKKAVNPEFAHVVKWLDGKKFAIGDYVTYVDFTFYELNQLMEHVTKSHFTDFPALKTYNENFASLDKIANYQSSERFPKDYTFNSPGYAKIC